MSRIGVQRAVVCEWIVVVEPTHNPGASATGICVRAEKLPPMRVSFLGPHKHPSVLALPNTYRRRYGPEGTGCGWVHLLIVGDTQREQGPARGTKVIDIYQQGEAAANMSKVSIDEVRGNDEVM